jgi:hypothetical protein
MNTEKPDIFGKIDALLGKRVPDALLEKELDIEDFPLLTEVLDTSPDALSDGNRRTAERRRAERREEDRRQGDRCQDGHREGGGAAAEPSPALPSDINAEMERLVAAMELRFTDMFIRQQLRMEDVVRKAIRDELGKKSPDELA